MVDLFSLSSKPEKCLEEVVRKNDPFQFEGLPVLHQSWEETKWLTFYKRNLYAWKVIYLKIPWSKHLANRIESWNMKHVQCKLLFKQW